jgi:hypothetical protein
MELCVVDGPAKGHHSHRADQAGGNCGPTESPSLVLVINDTKLLMPCVKWFKLDISKTCDEGACGIK